MEAKKNIEAQHICKSFYDPIEVKVLNQVSLTINVGEFVSIIGKSGCGKSTLLYILSTMDTSYTGNLSIDGVDMKGKKDVNTRNLQDL